MNSPIAAATVDLLLAWEVFKKTHDVNSVKVSCCENTKNLFVALELFEEVVLNVTGEKPIGED